MKLLLALRNGLMLSLVGISLFVIHYVLGYSSIFFSLIKFIISLLIIIWSVREYVIKTETHLKTLYGFTQYATHLMTVLFFSSLLNISFEYVIFNLTDPNYKYALEEEEFQKVNEHRMKKDLPPNYRMEREAIDNKYGWTGLYELNKAVYFVNFITVFLFYLVALFFAQFKPTSPDIYATSAKSVV